MVSQKMDYGISKDLAGFAKDHTDWLFKGMDISWIRIKKQFYKGIGGF
jgi:hypothetical protein